MSEKKMLSKAIKTGYICEFVRCDIPFPAQFKDTFLYDCDRVHLQAPFQIYLIYLGYGILR